MAAASVLKVACSLMMLCMLVAAPMANAAITCVQVSRGLAPCLGYLRGGGAVPVGCCNGIRRLNGAAQSTPDRQAACRCLQSAAKSIRGLNPTLAAGLPKACGVNIPYPISASTNCNTVK